MHWSDRYIDTPYVAQTGDCAAFAVRVAREVLHKEIALPTHAAGLRAQAVQIQALKNGFAVRVPAPIDAQPVLFVARGRFFHIGAAALIGGETWVAHADKAFGKVVCQRLLDMTAWNFGLEGFYKWL